MTRHIYSLIVDCPDPCIGVGAALCNLVEMLLRDAEGTRSVQIEVMVPHDGGIGLRPAVRLEEVKHAQASPG